MKEPSIAHQLTIAHFDIWLRLLIRHGFSLRQTGKVLLITLVCLLLTPFHIINTFIIFLGLKKLKEVEDPVFIIGHWRSGTTLLHYLLSMDSRFGYLTYYQAFVPTLTFVGGQFLKKIIANQIPERRPQDDVMLHADYPTEEENPLATMSLESASLSFYFPKDETYYKKYVLSEGVSSREKKAWQKSYTSLMNQIRLKFPSRQLLIKNPHNTGRIKELIELYPKAKFIYLFRNPYEVFPSTVLMYDKVVQTQYLQDYSMEETNQKVFYYYRTIIDRYIKTKNLIPEDQIIEINYHSLIADPWQKVQEIYDHWNWSLEKDTEDEMKSFIKGQSGYKFNKHNISDKVREQINKDLSFVFEEYDFPIENRD